MVIGIELQNVRSMLKNYIKIASRNLARFKVYSLINITGLVLGLTAGVLISVYVLDEIGYDDFHKNGDRIYKVVTKNLKGGHMETNAWPVAHLLEEKYPEVQSSLYTRESSMMVFFEGKRYDHEIHYVGSEFFDFFTFPLLEGDPKTALVNPSSIVITEEMKQRYFGSATALGKTLTLADSLDFEITGVLANIPEQSHIQFDMLLPFSHFARNSGFSYSEGWGNFNVRNYILLGERSEITSLHDQAAGLYMQKEYAGDRFRELGMAFELEFIPLKDIYLKSEVYNGFGPKGSIDKVYLVSGIAIFVILLACINFINLTTARSVYRAKEVGLRKLVGSARSSVFWQFLCESFVVTLIAFATVTLIIDLLLPYFNELIGKNYTIEVLFNVKVIVATIILIVAVSFLAGYYPAIVLSSFKPVDVLKGRMQNSKKGIQLRRGLVIFQFFISAALVLSTLIVLQQLDYMRSQDLGFQKEQTLVLDATRVPKSASHEAFKNALEKFSDVQSVSFNNALPGRPGWQGQWAYPEEIVESSQVTTEYMAIDEHYIETLGLTLVAGRNFDVGNQAELQDGVIINETTVKEMGWQTPENAIGKKIVSPSGFPQGTVIGVVKDYHGQGLQTEIWPKVMDYTSQDFGRYYAIKFNTGKTAELLDLARSKWSEYLGEYDFEYSFLDEDFDKQYEAEDQLIKVFTLFAIITVFIAGMGLLGLVSFMVLSRTKEIGIRKVLGADVFMLARLLSREFVILVLIANLMAIPLVWYFGQNWLENFAYHMQISPLIFILAVIISVTVAIIIVSTQTIKAALTNPVDTLKNE